jgi:hypothetical protein
MAERQITHLQAMPDELLAQVSTAQTQDVIGDQERVAVGNTTAKFGCTGGALTFFSFFVMGFFLPLGLLMLAVGVVLLIVAFVFGRRKAKLDEYDLDNDRLQLVRELIEVLKPDFSDKKPLRLMLAHGSSVKFGTASNQRTEGTWMTGKVDYCEYEDPWFRLSGRFQDGTVFRLGIQQSVKRKSKPKRKYTKVSDRLRDKVTLALRVPPAVYPDVAPLNTVLDPARLGSHVGLSVVALQAQGHSVRISATTGVFMKQILRSGSPESGAENKVHSSKIVGLLAFVYAGLSHCRVGAQAAPAPDPAPPAA